MADIRIPTFDELLARIRDAHLMSGPQLVHAIGAEEARDIFAQFHAQVADDETNPTKK